MTQLSVDWEDDLIYYDLLTNITHGLHKPKKDCDYTKMKIRNDSGGLSTLYKLKKY